MEAASLARVIGIGRIVIGAALLAAPKQTGSAWLGDPAEHPAGQLAVASLGARDMAIGAGTTWSLAGRRRNPDVWMLAGAAGDVADLLGVLRHREGLTTGALVSTALLAGGSAAAGVWLANELG